MSKFSRLKSWLPFESLGGVHSKALEVARTGQKKMCNFSKSIFVLAIPGPNWVTPALMAFSVTVEKTNRLMTVITANILRVSSNLFIRLIDSIAKGFGKFTFQSIQFPEV